MLIIWFDHFEALAQGDVNDREWRWCRTASGAAGATAGGIDHGVVDEGCGTLRSIADALASKPDEVTLLLAVRACLHLRLTAPPMTSRNLALALPYLAEEHLAGAVDDTHIAPGVRDGDQLTAFAVSKTLLRGLLDALARYDIVPVAVYSDASLIEAPVNGDEQACFLIDGHRVLMRGAHISLEADSDDLAAFLPSLLTQASEQNERDAPVRVLCAPDASLDAGMLETLVSLGINAKPLALAESPLARLVSGGFSSSTNLLVGEFQPSIKSTGKRGWRVPIALAALLLGFVLITDAVLAIAAQNRAAGLQAQAIERLDGAMNADEIVRMVNREQGGSGQETSYFIDLAVALSTVTAAGSANVRSLSYQQGSRALDVEMLVADYDQLDGISGEVQSVFVEAEMLGATQTDDGVRARFRLVGLQP